MQATVAVGLMPASLAILFAVMLRRVSCATSHRAKGRDSMPRRRAQQHPPNGLAPSRSEASWCWRSRTELDAGYPRLLGRPGTRRAVAAVAGVAALPPRG